MDGFLAVALRDGIMLEVDLYKKEEERKIVMEGHHHGDLWALDCVQQCAITTGEDNLIKIWDLIGKRCMYSSHLNMESHDKKHKRVNSQLIPSNSPDFRCVSINPVTGLIAIGMADGYISIRHFWNKKESLDRINHQFRVSDAIVTTVSYSPNGLLLAVGSFDSNIYIFETERH